MINIQHILNTLYKVDIETSNLQESIKRIVKDSENSIEAKRILIDIGLFDLLKIATRVNTWKLNTLTITLNIPWHQQTMARHLYGGCFPESIKRDVIVKNDCCNGDKIVRRYTFKHNDNSIVLEFYRDTFHGDKVDGCIVQLVSSTPSYTPHYDMPPRSYLSVSCPMNKSTWRKVQ